MIETLFKPTCIYDIDSIIREETCQLIFVIFPGPLEKILLLN